MSKVYGYIRVSSADQNEDRQLDVYKRQAVPLPSMVSTMGRPWLR